MRFGNNADSFKALQVPKVVSPTATPMSVDEMECSGVGGGPGGGGASAPAPGGDTGIAQLAAQVAAFAEPCGTQAQASSPPAPTSHARAVRCGGGGGESNAGCQERHCGGPAVPVVAVDNACITPRVARAAAPALGTYRKWTRSRQQRGVLVRKFVRGEALRAEKTNVGLVGSL